MNSSKCLEADIYQDHLGGDMGGQTMYKLSESDPLPVQPQLHQPEVATAPEDKMAEDQDINTAKSTAQDDDLEALVL